MKHSFGALILMQITRVVYLLKADESEIGSSVKGVENRVYMCPPKFVRLGRSCYYISADMASWQDAHFKCQRMSKVKSVTLAVLDDKWEDRNMKAFLNHPDLERKDRWIGAIYNWKLAKWQWGSTGTELRYNNKFLQRTKRNKKDYSWHCIVMNAKRKYNWKAEKCLRKKHYICETKLEMKKDPKLHQEYQLLRNEIPQL